MYDTSIPYKKRLKIALFNSPERTKRVKDFEASLKVVEQNGEVVPAWSFSEPLVGPRDSFFDLLEFCILNIDEENFHKRTFERNVTNLIRNLLMFCVFQFEDEVTADQVYEYCSLETEDNLITID